MSSWIGSVQSELDAGNPLIVGQSAHIKARSYSDGTVTPLGLWQGAESVSLTIDGEARTYLAAGEALLIDGLDVSVGLLVQGQRVTIRGINETIDTLQRSYDLNDAPFQVHDLAFTPGMAFLGYRQQFSGFVDSARLNKGDSEGDFSLVAVSALRRGTRKFDAMLDEARDPFFKYIAGNEGDAWG